MKRIVMGPRSWAALEGFGQYNRVPGEEPLDAMEWMVVLACTTLQMLAAANGDQEVYEESIRAIKEAALRSGATILAVNARMGEVTPPD